MVRPRFPGGRQADCDIRRYAGHRPFHLACFTASAMKRAISFVCIAALVAAGTVSSAEAAAVRPDHPLIGLWRLPYPNSSCAEIYRIGADGITVVTSHHEVAESECTVSDRPGPTGFYKWMHRTVRGNGEQDCSGHITEPGQEVTRYILLHPGGDVFVMCEDEDEALATCIGPFIRLPDADI